MARKKEVKKMPEAAPSLKHVRLDLELDDHRLLRAVAGVHGMSMVAYVRQLVKQNIREEAKRKGINL